MAYAKWSVKPSDQRGNHASGRAAKGWTRSDALSHPLSLSENIYVSPSSSIRCTVERIEPDDCKVRRFLPVGCFSHSLWHTTRRARDRQTRRRDDPGMARGLQARSFRSVSNFPSRFKPKTGKRSAGRLADRKDCVISKRLRQSDCSSSPFGTGRPNTTRTLIAPESRNRRGLPFDLRCRLRAVLVAK